MTLRTILIIVGVAIIVLVYLVTAIKRRRDSRASYQRGFSRLEIPDVILQHDEDLDEDDEPARGRGDRYRPRLPDDVVLPGGHEPLDELPAVRNDAREPASEPPARRGIDQLDLFGAGARESAAPDPAPAPSASPAAGNGLVTLYVRARADQQISGTDLVKALNGVGMKFGEMGIFHHYGSGDLKCDSPVFSAANMFEPGTFDLGRIEAFRTTGLALFMQLPGPLDGPVAFELLLSTAQRLAERIGARLCIDPRTPLDAQGIARLRSRAGRYGNVGA